MKNIKLVLTTAIFATLFGCVNNDNYAEPNISGNCEDLTPTKTVQNIAALANGTVKSYASTVPAGTSADDVIEAYVTSSDEGGNFYKSISMVSVDGAKGFSVPVDDYNLYTKFEPGRKVFVKMKDRYFYNNPLTNALEIGNLYDNGEPLADEVGRLEIVQYQDIVKRSCTKVDENTLVNISTIPALLNDANLNKLFEISGVQFSDSNVGKTYYDSNNEIGGATNNIVGDAAGNSLIVRISEFTNFAGKKVSPLNGKIRGVLTKYLGSYQFMVRTEKDIMLTNPRFDNAPAVGGSAITYLGSFTENFESYTAGSITTGQTNFPKYINDPAIGSKYWYTATFSSNKYIVMSSFSSNSTFQEQNNKSYFIVPVDFTAANNMQFKTQDRFNVGGVLKVYTSTNYIPNGDINAATLTNITSNFNIASGTTGSATTAFESSNLYSFPAGLTGNGFIIFEYTGGYSFTPDLTTTIHIDDIVIN
jgi:hypothetical protein